MTTTLPISEAPAGSKRCPACGGPGPFGRDRSQSDGMQTYCLACRRAQQRRSRQTPERRAWRKAYRARADVRARERLANAAAVARYRLRRTEGVRAREAG